MSSIGLEFARYSIDYHYIRNWLYVRSKWGVERAEQHIPTYAKRIIGGYKMHAQLHVDAAKEEGTTSETSVGSGMGGWWGLDQKEKLAGAGGWLEELDLKCRSNSNLPS